MCQTDFAIKEDSPRDLSPFCSESRSLLHKRTFSQYVVGNSQLNLKVCKTFSAKLDFDNDRESIYSDKPSSVNQPEGSYKPKCQRIEKMVLNSNSNLNVADMISPLDNFKPEPVELKRLESLHTSCNQSQTEQKRFDSNSVFKFQKRC